MAHFFLRAAGVGRRTAFVAASGSAVLLSGAGMAYATSCKEERDKHKILIVGGGSGGLAVAAQLQIKGEKDVAVIEPSENHYYQPLWTLVGGGGLPRQQEPTTREGRHALGCPLAQGQEAPVLVHNMGKVMRGEKPTAVYDGYTSCPLITVRTEGGREGGRGYSSLLLAEFKYGGEVAETFGRVIDQAEPRWAFLQLKKHVFPFAYWELFLRGRWFGTRGVIPPSFE
ncbi:hypothetical protein NSK_004014 [Nannochloropsis salina CCMP1776]|uniref:FAD/NAD(P)-binding domain-containing protein n=1 Tax=Nannochloropsis salina CCMP1776 TaxID=1027361 RepID=A0A4D9D7I7_9STRA|nr:hypothetical protein NSK_004014 [Nannochloropsis salina CCMP1776]|eukprot:TFJ84549.1 hypothetical protein NSK_004014 [Nannochloropsis salina CCMP1776]